MSRPRLPNGQRWIDAPIVYDIAPVSPLRREDFVLRASGDGFSACEWTWDELQRMPRIRVRRDFHCVTTWSVRDVIWEGVAARTLLKRAGVGRGLRWVIARSRDGYSTNVPFEAFARRDSLLADRMNGAPLGDPHGAPLRLVVPCLYAWKSAKYVDRLEFRSALERGFWEERGYHDRGDPWREERFRTQETE